MDNKKNVDAYTIGNMIGSGTFGEVYKAEHKHTKDAAAMKIIDMKLCGKKDKEHMYQEIAMLRLCNHGNLVQYKDSFDRHVSTTPFNPIHRKQLALRRQLSVFIYAKLAEGRYMYIVMELCTEGSLREHIQQNNGLNEDMCILVLRHVTSGIHYLHEQNIVHRDVKTTNIFLTKQGDNILAKIGDFGLARVLDVSAIPTLNVGSPYFMSPEMIDGKGYGKPICLANIGLTDKNVVFKYFKATVFGGNHPFIILENPAVNPLPDDVVSAGALFTNVTDIWSLGCCVYEMATTNIPFVASKMGSLKRKIIKGEFVIDVVQYCEDIKRMVQSMMSQKPEDRPEIAALLNFLMSHCHGNTLTSSQRSYGAESTDVVVSGRRSKARGKRRSTLSKTWSTGDFGKAKAESSGYDSANREPADECGARDVVTVKVSLNEEEMRIYKKAQMFEEDVRKCLGADADDVMRQINEAIKTTKQMESNTIFMSSVEKVIGNEAIFKKCKLDLQCLWTWKKELLLRNFNGDIEW